MIAVFYLTLKYNFRINTRLLRHGGPHAFSFMAAIVNKAYWEIFLTKRFQLCFSLFQRDGFPKSYLSGILIKNIYIDDIPLPVGDISLFTKCLQLA